MIQTVETKKTFSKQLSEIKKANEDFEWYPTTNEILSSFSSHLFDSIYSFRRWGRYRSSYSVLDVGAGNGKVLDHIRGSDDHRFFGPFYAIEKSQSHLSNLSPEIYILGVDFWKTNLMDKQVDVVFCNPPYCEYENWCEKIITEVQGPALVYLVIPERWKNSKKIKAAIDSRKIEF